MKHHRPTARVLASRTMTILGGSLAVALVSACGSSGGTNAPTSPPTGAVTSTSASSGTSSASGGSASATSHPTESNPPGDIPDNQAYVPFAPAGSTVTVKVPEGWGRTTTAGATVFSDKLNSIRISVTKSSTAPTVASVRSHDLPMLQATVPNYAPGKVTTVTRRAGTAILATYQGDSAPNPVTGKVVRDAFERYTFQHGQTRVDLTLAGPTNADNVDPWRIVSDSLAWH
ncbi:hypothetical protein BJ986_001829 [Phycicoccus badiiscoriae]|uniref:Lipoprotein n=1 Tax=Pedococcus badiiscoriae TaxID=642776 RepID=A0A852WQ24_9MICO|nr:hypothetical protein [Pedococcus badiiscoriae]NYG07342.1 hypothetical protein [Pedococcus badiiscoriae]